MGTYLRRALPRELARRGVTWPCEVCWNARRIRARIIRGELSIVEEVAIGGMVWMGEIVRQSRWWWNPTTRERGDELAAAFADRLERRYQFYREADETGRLTVTAWRDPRFETTYSFEEVAGAEPMRVRLAPGWRVDAREGRVVGLRGETRTLAGMVREGEAGQ